MKANIAFPMCSESAEENDLVRRQRMVHLGIPNLCNLWRLSGQCVMLAYFTF